MSYTGVANTGSYDYFIYIDAFDSNKIKARNNATGQVQFNHASDFGNVFNSCVDALSSGGGIELDNGTFLTTTSCIIKNFIRVRGQGTASIVKLANGVNGGVHVMATPDVDSMTGSDDVAGVNTIHDVILKDFVIDGNKANNATGGCGLKKYSYGWIIEDITIQYCKSHGLVSEWGETAGVAVPGGRGMEDELRGLMVMRCDGKGIYWRGPHDTQFTGCISFGHGLEAWHMQSGTGFSGGSTLVQCHTWSTGTVTPSDSLFIDNTFCSGSNIIAEGAHPTKAAIHLTQSAKLVASNVWAFASGTGLLIESENNDIQGYVSGCDLVGVSVQSNHNRLDLYILETTGPAGFGLVLGSASKTIEYNEIKAKISKNNDHAVSWDRSTHQNNVLDLMLVVDTGETAFNNVGNVNTSLNTVEVYSIGPGTHNFSGAYQVYNQALRVRVDAAEAMRILRPNVGGPGTGTGMAFALYDAGSNETVYAQILARIVDNSNPNADGQLSFYTTNNDTVAERMVLTNGGTLQIGDNLRMRLSESGLTGARTLTMQDADTTIAGTNVATQVFTQEQIIRKDIADTLTLHRINNGTVGTGIAFNLGTSPTHGNQYAKIYGFAVTASPLVGRLEFWLPNNSSNAKRLAILADGALETQSYIDVTKISAPADPGAELGRVYFKTIDANNNGLFVKLKKNGIIVEEQLV